MPSVSHAEVFVSEIERKWLRCAGLKLAVAYGYLHQSRFAEVDIALDEVCAMSWRLSGR